ncbi:MAG: hypothetical protein Aurels2KO_17840 [Aureliella sp.]
MPIVRDPRNDRRRRVLRENAALEQAESAAKSKRSTAKRNGKTDNVVTRKGAGYSQDVRQACGHRLVQLIPVRPMSYAIVIAVSLLIPALLSAAHYLVYVNGKLPWYGHPLALTLDANYNRSIASWVTGQLWLLCLGATVLTFQLRRHKLDDYSGEYRLWFWLVLTCIIGSLESSTGIIQLFSMALNNWSTTTLGWSGPAVVKATLAVLVGMLGLRLCTELKAAPSSVALVMLGLAAWAISSALAQPEFQIEISPQIRVWARCSLWIGGLTCIWLAALANLRHVYIEAQQRFLSRRRMLAPAGSMPISERIRGAIPRLPSRNRDADSATETGSDTRSRWRLPNLRRSKADDGSLETKTKPSRTNRKDRKKGVDDNASNQQPSQHNAGDDSPQNEAEPRKAARNPPSQARGEQRTGQDTSNPKAKQNDPAKQSSEHSDGEAKPRRGLGGFFRRGNRDEKPSTDVQSSRSNQPTAAAESRKQETVAKGENRNAAQEESAGEKKPSRLTGWLRKPKHSDDAEEYRKVSRDAEAKEATQSKRKQRKQNAASDEQTETPEGRSPRRWIPRVPKPKLPQMKKPSFGWLPKFNLSALRLKPPGEQASDTDQSGSSKATKRKVAASQELPSTSPQQSNSASEEADNPESSRPLTKAERKRLRRMQQQNRAA